jgi:hypothetical protein
MTDGYSFESFAGTIGVGRRVLFNWQNTHPEFKDAHDRASCAALLWWERVGRAGMASRTFNTAVWIFTMKNMFGWRDVQENIHVGDASRPLAVQTLQEAFAKGAGKIKTFDDIEERTEALIHAGGNGKSNGNTPVH